MADFKFLKNSVTGKTVISAPRRAKRPNSEESKHLQICPFCIGTETEEELYRVGRNSGDWLVRVISNKFPFTPHHEIVILSPDHHKGFDELPFSHLEIILKTYRERYNFHMNGSHSAKASRDKQVYIFHNGGLGSGESIPHPHTQIAVVPNNIKLEIPILPVIARSIKRRSNLLHGIAALTSFARNDDNKEEVLESESFLIFCPTASEWPDEVWVAPKRHGQVFGSINDEETTDLAFVVSRLIQTFDLRHGHEFPFNFYIYPGKNWYFRLIPRMKILGGFELGTGVMVNTQNPAETMAFVKEHFWQPDAEKIKTEHQADYLKSI